MHSLHTKDATLIFNSDLSGDAYVVTEIEGKAYRYSVPGDLLQKLVNYINAGNEDQAEKPKCIGYSGGEPCNGEWCCAGDDEDQAAMQLRANFEREVERTLHEDVFRPYPGNTWLEDWPGTPVDVVDSDLPGSQPMLPLYPGRSDEPEATDLAHMVNPCDCDEFSHYHSRGPGCE